MTFVATTQPGPAIPLFDTGSEACPYQGQMPVAITFSDAERAAVANPLQHLPVVGMIYRAFSGETLPEPVKIADAVVSGAVLGGPIGLVGTLLMSLVTELARLGPDRSRPPVPDGMDETGSEAAMRPVTPGTHERPGGYTTLATTLPDFLYQPVRVVDSGGDAGGVTSVTDRAPTMLAGPDAPVVTDMAGEAAARMLAAYDWQRTALARQGVG